MSTQQPGTGPAPERPEDDDTVRLDPVSPTVPDAAGPASEPVPPVGSSPAEASEPRARRGSRRRRVRVGTVVWGLVVAVCGALTLGVAGGADIDGGTVAIAILGGAGVALVVGSIMTGVRRREQD